MIACPALRSSSEDQLNIIAGLRRDLRYFRLKLWASRIAFAARSKPIWQLKHSSSMLHFESRQFRTGKNVAAVVVFLAYCLVSIADAELRFVQSDGSLADKLKPVPVLLSYGEETATVTVLYRGNENVKSARIKALEKSDAGLWTAGDVVTGTANQDLGPQGWVNYTLPFFFEEGVGIAKWAFEVELDTGEKEVVEGQFIIAGIVVKKGNEIVSGIGRGVNLGTFEDVLDENTLELNVEAIGTDGTHIADLQQVDLTARDAKGVDLKQVDDVAIHSDGRLRIKFAPYRTGSGKLTVDMDFAGIELEGEIFESVLNINFDTSAIPPPVVIAESISTSPDGLTSMKAFNLLKPPAKSDAEECVLAVGDTKITHDPTASRFVQPDQLLVFKTEGSKGSATLSCDGRDAVILSGDSTSSTFEIHAKDDSGSVMPSSSNNSTLAKNLIKPPLEERTGKARLQSQLRVVSGDPSSYSVHDAEKILEAVCHFSSGSNCILLNVTKGSAILDIQNYVKQGSEEDSREKLESSIKTCKFQKRVAVSCDEIELNRAVAVQSNSKAEAGTHIRRSGLPKWAVGLSAVFGAIALVCLVIGALWLMHHHQREQEESDFSSSGPLGVPGGDNALYRQAIVRDIYGRGDFSQGLPTAADVELTRRNAELQDLKLRPPSSSAASSRLRAPTDEASSTYTV